MLSEVKEAKVETGVPWPPLGPLFLDVNLTFSLIHVLKLLRFQTSCGLQPTSLCRWTLGICDENGQRLVPVDLARVFAVTQSPYLMTVSCVLGLSSCRGFHGLSVLRTICFLGSEADLG